MPPVVKKPKVPVAFPPANHLRAYQVRDGDNWWTLQKQFGLKDPWSLIRYNFRTDDPAEVNWYLREYVGCVLTTPDGKNYRFSSTAKPGLLYLPRHNFKHGRGGGGLGGGTCDDEPEQTPQKDTKAHRDVLWALNKSAVGSIQFSYGIRCGRTTTTASAGWSPRARSSSRTTRRSTRAPPTPPAPTASTWA
jgi:hypothetical protein